MPRTKCEHNIIKVNCVKCHPSILCEHNKRKRYCRICCPDTYCEHNTRKIDCKFCNPNSRCEHGKNKMICVECHGSQVCEHDKIKMRCKLCHGSQICSHNINKQNCKLCHGSQICCHGKDKKCCGKCRGSSYCIHDKLKKFCKECGGVSLCEHDKQRSHCKICHGSAICPHNKSKYMCHECGGNGICQHDKQKSRCKECGGKDLCKSTLCETRASKKYDGYCLFCFIHLFPDKPISRNYKTKEKTVVDFIKENFTNLTLIHDRKVIDGCSQRRPDVIIDLGYQVVIVEVDENQHISYDCSCENKRLMQISQDVGHRNIIFIRFNPDSYFDKDGNKIKSCWYMNHHGILLIKKKYESEWNNRLENLKNQVEYWINPDHKTNKMVEVIQMYYDEK